MRRKKNKNSPAKCRRSGIIYLKNNPIARRIPLRNTRSTAKYRTAEYESPLQHFYKNDPSIQYEKLFTLTNSIVNNGIKKNNKNTNNIQSECSDISNLPSTSKDVINVTENTTTQEKNIHEENDQNIVMNVVCTDTATTCVMTGTEKSDLNNFNDTNSSLPRISEKINGENEDNNFSDSVIFVNETNFNLTFKTESSDLETYKLSNEHDETAVNIDSSMNSELVAIDCNQSLLSEIDARDNAFDTNVNTFDNASKFTDSVIVIDDELPASTENVLPKFNEDCFVVWSSLPSPSNKKSNNSPKLNKSLLNKDLKCSKPKSSLLDFINLRLSDENNKPWNKKTKKETKNFLTTKSAKTNIQNKSAKTNVQNKSIKTNIQNKSPKTNVQNKSTKTNVQNKSTKTNVQNKSTKTNVQNKSAKTNVQNKSALEPSSIVTMKSKNKLVKVPTKKVTKKAAKKARNSAIIKNNELIFLSESKEENETPTKTKNVKKGHLREIVIDGSNVAMAYTNNKNFSEKGIKVLIDYFKTKGHTIRVFVPQYRRSRLFPLLEKWHSQGIVVFTPSRKLGQKTFTSYDDRYILEYATACDGIVVSQDQFRDLYAENPQYRDTIENRLLVPTFVGEYVMFPVDPLGKDGPTLTEFLTHQ